MTTSVSGAPAASFRDPCGSLVHVDGRIFRLVSAAGMADLSAFLAAPSARASLDSGRVARTRVLENGEVAQLLDDSAVRELHEAYHAQAILEHERITFPSYPYEWAPEMLHSAGDLTIELALGLVPDGLGLKDGTPYNVLFRGPEPVFIDLLSFERRAPDDPTWLAYAQFVRTFVLPLAANRHFGLPIAQTLTTSRDGLEPEEVYRWLGPLRKFRPPFLSLVSMPVWLARKHDVDDASIYRRKSAGSPEKAQFVLEMLFRGLKRALGRVAPKRRASHWSGYMSSSNYSPEHFEAKSRFVDEAVAEFAPRRVLDVGCNTGHFSMLAARRGAEVVAIDYDPAVVGEVWRVARAERLNVLPLVVNLTRPTPGTGWRNRECPSFLDRARGAFDCVFMLAVIHHMLVTERIPLPEIVDQAAELTTDLAIIEFVGPEDSMFRRLTRGREALHADLTPELFERVCARRFETVRSQHIEGTGRWTYLLRKK